MYNYPSYYQIKKIHELMDKGITDKWEIEEIINNPHTNNPIIIDYIESEMNIYKRRKK